jgi:micrococcal nuclease
MYTYKAKVGRVIDGDTVVLEIDLGFNIFHVMSCRLLGVNAPELNAKDEETQFYAVKSKEFLMSLLPVGKIVTIKSKKLDKYGRALVLIDGVNDEMNIYMATCKTFVKK